MFAALRAWQLMRLRSPPEFLARRRAGRNLVAISRNGQLWAGGGAHLGFSSGPELEAAKFDILG